MTSEQKFSKISKGIMDVMERYEVAVGVFAVAFEVDGILHMYT